MATASEKFPVMPGAEAFASPGAESGSAERRRTGVLLIHGFTGNPCSMRPLGELLVKAGFRAEIPRLPGHGTDPRDMQLTRYSDWRAEVSRGVERLAKDSDRVFLVGLSMGGSLALDVAAAEECSIAGVVVINPQILDRDGPALKLAPLLERVLPLAPPRLAGLHKDDIARPGVSEHAYDWVPTAAGNSFLRELPRIRKNLTKLTCPVLVAHSLQDHSVPPKNSEAVLRLVPGAEELLLERSYHVAPLDYDLELLATRIESFMDRLKPS